MSPHAQRPSRPRRLYIDTSAYLCILLGDEGWERLSRETAGSELLSSVLVVLETRRNLTRLAREGALDPKQYAACMARVEEDASVLELRDFTFDLCGASPLPAVATPRSLDLAHLRTALWFHAAAPIDRFVTTDTPQQEAARELGLPV